MTTRQLTPSEILQGQTAGLMYDRVPPSSTLTHPTPSPVWGFGNLLYRLLHVPGLVVSRPTSQPFSITPSSRPTQLAGFVNFNQPLPAKLNAPARTGG